MLLVLRRRGRYEMSFFTLHGSYNSLIKCLKYVKGYFNKSGVSAVAATVVPPEEHFPKMGYFHKSIPSHTYVPPQKIAGTNILNTYP